MVVLTSDVNTLQRLISSNTLGLFGGMLSFCRAGVDADSKLASQR